VDDFWLFLFPARHVFLVKPIEECKSFFCSRIHKVFASFRFEISTNGIQAGDKGGLLICIVAFLHHHLHKLPNFGCLRSRSIGGRDDGFADFIEERKIFWAKIQILQL